MRIVLVTLLSSNKYEMITEALIVLGHRVKTSHQHPTKTPPPKEEPAALFLPTIVL